MFTDVRDEAKCLQQDVFVERLAWQHSMESCSMGSSSCASTWPGLLQVGAALLAPVCCMGALRNKLELNEWRIWLCATASPMGASLSLPLLVLGHPFFVGVCVSWGMEMLWIWGVNFFIFLSFFCLSVYLGSSLSQFIRYSHEHKWRQCRALLEDAEGEASTAVGRCRWPCPWTHCSLPLPEVSAKWLPGSASCHETLLQNLIFSFYSNSQPASHKAKNNLKAQCKA